MGKLEFRLENEKSAVLTVTEAREEFGVFRRPGDCYSIGFRQSPLFELSLSMVNERWEVDVLKGRLMTSRAPSLDASALEWLRDSCCDDFSILEALPNGAYHLIKTAKKPAAPKEILMGNEWIDRPANVLGLQGVDQESCYALIVGSDAETAPSLRSPLLGIILKDYGIVWEGATGFMFFSFADPARESQPAGDMILLLSEAQGFVVAPPTSASRRSSTKENPITAFARLVS
jgi:hypothetical protein